MAHRSDHILTYTSGGRERLIDLGIDDFKVTAVMNTIDTRVIQSAIDSLQETELTDFLLEHNLNRGTTFLSFIGALDQTKRIRFIAEILDVLWRINPEIKILVGGSGPDRHLLNESVARGQTIYLGRVGPHEKAIISKLASCIVNPGNTGLLAVDALVMGIPIVGTSTLSSPEKDYLAEGQSFYTLPNNSERFAQELNRLAISRELPRFAAATPSLKNFVNNFSAAIREQLPSEIQNKLLLVTNLPAPYRLSLFEAIAKHFDLTVAYTGWADEGRLWENATSTSIYKSTSPKRLVGIGKFKIPFATRALKQLVKDSDFVFTGGWHSPAFLSSMRLARRNGIPSFLWFESTLDSARFKSGPIASFRSRVFSQADAIFVPGITAARAAEAYAKGRTPVIILSNPINKTYLAAAGHNLPKTRSKGTRFLFLGRLLQLKRIDLLISAFELVASEDDTLAIVGDGPMREKLKEQAAQTEFRNNIFFRPGVKDSEAINIYRQHDVLVLPSDREVWGMVAAEALVLNLQVVASDAIGATESLKQFPTFHSFQSDSISDLASGLRSSKISRNLTEQSKSELLKLNSPVVFAEKFHEKLSFFAKKSEHSSFRGRQ
jgi:glycosyltransferase involved in cell wall biosynthesis